MNSVQFSEEKSNIYETALQEFWFLLQSYENSCFKNAHGQRRDVELGNVFTLGGFNAEKFGSTIHGVDYLIVSEKLMSSFENK